MPFDVATIRGAGWRQGSVFTAESSRELLGNGNWVDNTRLILASQDCDILHQGNGEPNVDAFVATRMQRAVVLDEKARNARRLQQTRSSKQLPNIAGCDGSKVFRSHWA